MADDLIPQPHGGALAPPFSATRRPANPGRVSVRERHADKITLAQDIAAGSLVEVMRAAVDIALGNAVEHMINHKTGVVHEVPVQPATRLKAQQMVVDRIMGKAEQTKTHEIGENAAGMFSVLLGAAAQDHWGRLDAPPQPQFLEANFGEANAETEAQAEAAPAPGLLSEAE